MRKWIENQLMVGVAFIFGLFFWGSEKVQGICFVEVPNLEFGEHQIGSPEIKKCVHGKGTSKECFQFSAKVEDGQLPRVKIKDELPFGGKKKTNWTLSLGLKTAFCTEDGKELEGAKLFLRNSIKVNDLGEGNVKKLTGSGYTVVTESMNKIVQVNYLDNQDLQGKNDFEVVIGESRKDSFMLQVPKSSLVEAGEYKATLEWGVESAYEEREEVPAAENLRESLEWIKRLSTFLTETSCGRGDSNFRFRGFVGGLENYVPIRREYGAIDKNKLHIEVLKEAARMLAEERYSSLFKIVKRPECVDVKGIRNIDDFNRFRKQFHFRDKGKDGFEVTSSEINIGKIYVNMISIKLKSIFAAVTQDIRRKQFQDALQEIIDIYRILTDHFFSFDNQRFKEAIQFFQGLSDDFKDSPMKLKLYYADRIDEGVREGEDGYREMEVETTIRDLLSTGDFVVAFGGRAREVQLMGGQTLLERVLLEQRVNQGKGRPGCQFCVNGVTKISLKPAAAPVAAPAASGVPVPAVPGGEKPPRAALPAQSGASPAAVAGEGANQGQAPADEVADPAKETAAVPKSGALASPAGVSKSAEKRVEAVGKPAPVRKPKK